MAEFYVMPAISPTMEVGTLVEWRVQEGEAFKSPTVVADVGTDKANMEAEIFDDGVMLKHLIGEDDEVPPGFPIAIWGAEGDDISALLTEFESKKAELASGAPPAEAEPAAAATPEPAPAATKAPEPAPPAPAPTAFEAPPAREWAGKPIGPNFADPPGDLRVSASRAVKASPLARAVAKDLGVPLQRVEGSGPGGRIVRADVEGFTGGTRRAGPPPADQAIRNTPMRKTIARRMLESTSSIPEFYLTATFDVGRLVALRSDMKAVEPDVRVSYNDMVLKAVALALRDNPDVNASWTDKAIIHKGAVDVGMAVAIDGGGLITPVIRSCDTKTLAEIGGETRELAKRARAMKLDPSEYTGSTFTVSNLGMMDIEHFTAIINPPEAAILAVGELAQVPVVVDGALTIGWRMKVTMTCDHRVIDGAVGARFLQSVRSYIERPYQLLAR